MPSIRAEQPRHGSSFSARVPPRRASFLLVLFSAVTRNPLGTTPAGFFWGREREHSRQISKTPHPRYTSMEQLCAGVRSEPGGGFMRRFTLSMAVILLVVTAVSVSAQVRGTARLQGTVTDKSTGKPIEGAVVTV